MQRFVTLLATVTFVASLAGAVEAAPCRDAKGKFIKCPAPAAATKCRDKTTKKFAKCGAPNTEAMPKR